MKKTILQFVAIALGGSAAGAGLPGELAVSSDISYASRYVFRGIKETGESVQPTLEVALGDLYGGVWGNFPTGAEQRKLNYYGGFGFLIPGLGFAAFDAGVTVYDYPGSGMDRTHEAYLGANFTLPERPALRGSVFYSYDVDLRSHVGEAKVTYSRTLERIGLPAAVDFSFLGGLHGGGEVKTESYSYYGASVELPLILSDTALLTTGIHYEAAEKVSFGPGERGRNLFWNVAYTTFF